MLPVDLTSLRLNLGCGHHLIDGYVNIDAQENVEHPADMISDVKSIALPDGCASEILAVHLWEHLYRWECEEVITEWHRLLEPGGLLVMEMPDLMKFCRNVVAAKPDRIGILGMYGDPIYKDPYMSHKWGWTFKTIRHFLECHGFVDVKERPIEFHIRHGLDRDFRVEANKA